MASRSGPGRPDAAGVSLVGSGAQHGAEGDHESEAGLRKQAFSQTSTDQLFNVVQGSVVCWRQ